MQIALHTNFAASRKEQISDVVERINVDAREKPGHDD
jgi:hypothetical protein